MKKFLCFVFFIIIILNAKGQNDTEIVVNLDGPNPGRLMLLLSKDSTKEPRYQITDDYNTQIAIGIDIEEGKVANQVTFPAKGQVTYPINNWNEIPEGDYYAQVVLNYYKKFNLATGHNVWLPEEMGEGQQWNSKPMNLYSKPVKINIAYNKKNKFVIEANQLIGPIEKPTNTAYVRHIEMKSQILSKFWGQPVMLGAHILIPKNFDEEPNRKYPLMIYHGHFPKDFNGFSETPPPANMDTSDYSSRFNIYGYNKLQKQEAHNFYKQWTSDTFPRFLIIEIQHATPYYDDSYAVNSACQGPYGDAITYELIPYIEKIYRGIGKKGRFLYGGSTGGWEALAAQVFYPDEYNGCFAACPDPVDFRAYTTINLYKDKNAYYTEGAITKIPKPAKRNYLGHVSSTMEMTNKYEAVLGSKSRSGQQFDIWEATFSPMDNDGYPKRVFNKETGEINSEVAAYWKENFDLVHIMKRDWNTLGKKVEGKINLYCGDMDNFYLNNAVYLAEEFLKSTVNPHYNGEVKYGDKAEHCWNGHPTLPNHITRLRYHTMYLDKIRARLKKEGIKF
jgi:hypothetical protein